jgi:hypothetical protein
MFDEPDGLEAWRDLFRAFPDRPLPVVTGERAPAAGPPRWAPARGRATGALAAAPTVATLRGAYTAADAFQGIPALVRDLCAATGSRPDDVAPGLADDNPPTPSSAAAWGRLATALGLSFRQARLHLLLTLADTFRVDPVPLLARTRDESATPGSLATECEQFLEAEFARRGPADRALVLDCERALEWAFTG